MLLVSLLGNMIIYLQWAMAVPQDWTAVNVTRDQQIRNASKKAVPTGGEVLDNNPGWLLGANCQGIQFGGYDHIAIQTLPGNGLRITGWQDDTVDFGDTRWATRWDLMPPAPDSNLGGVVNTVQTRTIWATPDAAVWFPDVVVLPWADFIVPPANMTFHGIWVTEQQYADHLSIRTPHGWREWI